MPSAGFAVTSGMTLILCPALGRAFNSKENGLFSFQFQSTVKYEGTTSHFKYVCSRNDRRCSGSIYLRAVLLYVLDLVRGEPTAHGLDQDPHEIETTRECLLNETSSTHLLAMRH